MEKQQSEIKKLLDQIDEVRSSVPLREVTEFDVRVAGEFAEHFGGIDKLREALNTLASLQVSGAYVAGAESQARPKHHQQQQQQPTNQIGRGTRTVSGFLVRIDDGHAVLKLRDGTILACGIVPEQERHLIDEIGNQITIYGDATWDLNDRSIFTFSVRSFRTHPRTTPKEAFQLLASAAAEAWDGIDAEQFVRDSRQGRVVE